MKKYIFLSLFAIFILLLYTSMQYFAFFDGKLHIIFCNVGQGDAIVIKTAQNSLMLIDSGPDTRVGDCLSRHTPFWIHEITIAILTHPHADHLNGFSTVLKKYTVDAFVTERLANTTIGYKSLLKSIKTGHIPEQIVLQGDRLASSTFSLSFVGPSDLYLDKTSPHGTIGETGEFGSLETLVQYGAFKALLTGDSQIAEMQEALPVVRGAVDVLQVPHHGSRFGLDEKIVQALHPRLAVISVGKNTYGHPAPSTLQILTSLGIQILRTDQHGDVEVISDGKGYSLR